MQKEQITLLAEPEHVTRLADGTTYTPFVREGTVGLKCERPNAPLLYIYFNPSDHTDETDPNVFVYQGAEADPAIDGPEHYYLIWPLGDDAQRAGVR